MSARITRSFAVADTDVLKRQALQWASQFSHLHFFNSNNLPYPFGAFATRLAVGCAREMQIKDVPITGIFEQIKAFHHQCQDWLVGYLSYDLKNEIEALSSQNTDRLHFPPACFYQPQHL